MAGEPDVSIRIDLCNIGEEIDRGSVVSVLVVHGLDDAGQICGISGVLAVADLSPQI